MRRIKPKELRAKLGLARAELARFLGVSEPTIVRWETSEATSEPKGLQALLLVALADGIERHSAEAMLRLVRSCAIDHRAALRELLDAAESPR